MNTIRILLLAYIFLKTCVLGAQNDGFEAGQMNCCRADVNCVNDNVLPFNKGLINDWFASHGSPQINNVNCSNNENIVNSGVMSAFLHYSSLNEEGIFRAFEIKRNESVTIRLFARKDAVNGSIIVKLTNGLTNDNSGTGSVPTPSTSQLVISKSLSSVCEEISAVEIIADNNYSQLWIYGTAGSIVVDDVSTKVSCCKSHQVYQAIVNPPSTFVNDYILAGRNVSSALPQGDVEVKNTDQINPTIFQAGNEIHLEPGFVTADGAGFIAQIKPCSQTPIAITISNVSDSNDPCHSKYKAEACFGSGFYTYTWSEDVRSGPFDAETKSIANGAEWFGKTITVTVVDNITSQVATKSVVMPAWLPFVEPIDSGSLAISNSVSLNGDSLNADWFVLDLNRPNTFVWAYNAYEVDYKVFSQFSEMICSDKRTDKINGVWDKFIFCDGLAMCEPQLNWLWYELLLKNCKSEIIVPGVVSVLNCPQNSSMPSLTDTGSIEHLVTVFRDADVMVKPNPFIDIIQVVNLNGVHDCRIYDINGRLVYNGLVSELCNNIIDLKFLVSGVYYFWINDKFQKIVKI